MVDSTANLQDSRPAKSQLDPIIVGDRQGRKYSAINSMKLALGCCRFDLDRFYKEVQLVLKPGATFAAWGYDLNYFPGHGQAALYPFVLH